SGNAASASHDRPCRDGMGGSPVFDKRPYPVMSKNVNQADIGGRNVGPGWRLGLAPRLIRRTAASSFHDNPCTDWRIARFPTSGRTTRGLDWFELYLRV